VIAYEPVCAIGTGEFSEPCGRPGAGRPSLARGFPVSTAPMAPCECAIMYGGLFNAGRQHAVT